MPEVWSWCSRVHGSCASSLLKDALATKGSPGIADGFIEYFENNFIGKVLRVTRRADGSVRKIRKNPPKPIDSWSVYQRRINGKPGTTNNAEGWNNKAGQDNPPHTGVNAFTNYLRDQELKAASDAHASLHVNVEPDLAPKHERDRQARIELAFKKDRTDVLEYLRGLSIATRAAKASRKKTPSMSQSNSQPSSSQLTSHHTAHHTTDHTAHHTTDHTTDHTPDDLVENFFSD